MNENALNSGGGWKPYMQGLLRRAGLYERIKTSRVYDLYWTICDKRVLESRRAEVKFYQRTLIGLAPGDLVFDVGANEGAKTDIFLRLGTRVVAIDPDEVNQEVLRHRFVKYRLVHKPVVLVAKAVTDREATETMWIDAPGSAKNTLSQKWVTTLRNDADRFSERFEFAHTKRVQTVNLDHLMEVYGTPFFIKIDVEGLEPAVIRGLKRPVPFLSFEVNLPEFRPEGLECVGMLSALDRGGLFNYATDCEMGLALDRWVDAAAFAGVLESCEDPSVEVFWSTKVRQ
jgi:FkbM family methyltransferase